MEPRYINNIIKQYYKNKMKRRLEYMKDNFKIHYASKEDHNYIMKQIVLTYAFRVVRIVINIFSISYFIGTLWYIFTWLTDDGVSTNSTFFGNYKFR